MGRGRPCQNMRQQPAIILTGGDSLQFRKACLLWLLLKLCFQSRFYVASPWPSGALLGGW